MNRRTIAWWVLGLLLIGALTGVLIMAWVYPAPDTSAIENSTRAPLVTATVAERDSRARATLSATLIPAKRVAVNPTVDTVPGPSSEGEGTTVGAGISPVLRVVSRRVHSAGDRVSPGDLLAEISDRPVYAFTVKAPLYRDLVVGSVGSDVRALQRMLAGAGYFHDVVDGRFRSSTLAALTRLYARDGYHLVDVGGSRGMPLSETAHLPGKRLRVAASAARGAEVTTERPMLTVETRAAVVRARADLLQIDAFDKGTSVSLQLGTAESVTAKVASVSAFQEAESSTPPGYDITIALPPRVDTQSAASGPILVSEAGSIPQALSVPATAIRTDAGGENYVLVVPSDSSGGAQPRHVPVTVATEVAGYVILADAGELVAGTEVVVSGG